MVEACEIVGTSSSSSSSSTDDLFCPQCDYNLRGLTSPRCPECGFAVDAVLAGESVIPWVRRKHLGFWSAYWRTVWVATFRQRKLRNAMARPVSFAESQRFRWTTILFAYVPLLAVTALAYWVWWGDRIGEPSIAELMGWVWPMAAVHLGYVLCLAAVTGLPSYFFHPKDLSIAKQNRAIALSYYTCGPLAMLMLPVGLMIVGGYARPDSRAQVALLTIAGSLLVVQASAWYFNVIDWVRWLMPGRVLRTTVIACAVPFLWLLVGILTLLSVPAVVAYIALIIASFA